MSYFLCLIMVIVNVLLINYFSGGRLFRSALTLFSNELSGIVQNEEKLTYFELICPSVVDCKNVVGKTKTEFSTCIITLSKLIRAELVILLITLATVLLIDVVAVVFLFISIYTPCYKR